MSSSSEIGAIPMR